MELVYLWVEEYKNIHKQGFNFSSKFNCNYDPDTNALTIDENDDYIENFFGENINVTAIVGKNGSGKSSMLKLITLFRFEKLKQYLEKKTIVMVFENNEKLYIPYKYSGGYGGDSFKSFDTNRVNNKSSFKIYENEKIMHNSLFWLTLFTNGLPDFTEGKYFLQGSHFESFYNGSNNSGDNEEYKFQKKFASLLKNDTKIFNILNEDFIFNKMHVEIDLKEIPENIYEDKELKDIERFFKKNINNVSYTLGEKSRIITKELLIYNFLAAYFFTKYVDVIKDPPRHLNREKFKEVFLDNSLTIFINDIDKNSQNNSNFYEVIESIIIKIKSLYIELKKFILDSCKDMPGEVSHFNGRSKELESINEYEEIIQYMVNNFEIDLNTLKLKSKISQINEPNIQEFYQLVDSNDLYNDLYLSGRLYLNFIHEEKSNMTFNSLSTGEKQLIRFITNFLYTLIDTKYDNRMIFLEEIETSFHPQWQKKFIDIIIKFIYRIKENKLVPYKNIYHLIFTTHSPFLLSDIPKQNIIFLGKDEEGNCKVVDGLKEKKQTFGANIHTLLSDSFFMEDGFIGEFAKGKIEEVVNFLRNEESKIKDHMEAEKIIGIVGEPVLKMRLESMLDKYKIEHQIETAEDIQKKIDTLQRKLAEINNG